MTDKAKAFIAALHRKTEPNDFQKFHNQIRADNRHRRRTGRRVVRIEQNNAETKTP